MATATRGRNSFVRSFGDSPADRLRNNVRIRTPSIAKTIPEAIPATNAVQKPDIVYSRFKLV